MALVPTTDKREDRLLERLTLAEERAALATERALGAEAVARAVAARDAAQHGGVRQPRVAPCGARLAALRAERTPADAR